MLEFAPYLLYSVNRDFATSGGTEIPVAKAAPSGASRFFFPSIVLAVLISLTIATPIATAQQPAQALELSRTIRTWEFLPVVGTRAALFGNETGRLEAWVYPLKIFREFHLDRKSTRLNSSHT